MALLRSNIQQTYLTHHELKSIVNIIIIIVISFTIIIIIVIIIYHL